MASNITNKIGCQAGKTKIVDPNNFDGFNSESNMSVPLEDLDISVVLRTYRKGRTVLTSTGGDAKKNTRESSATISINFIEGSNVAGKKVLTTKYTDLTVLASDSSNDEALGITNIDIDFNSSMAPMVTINFIDVRGSAIFQNEQNISGNNTGNKYSTFFQLPYPLFELEIKGYYGKPVKYCLHMLKFNSKFNSQTGNFEITCQFIGYTYAMLSDMLIGYLKAIPFTKIGKEKHDKYEQERGYEVLTLVELMKKISEINEGIEKVGATSENAGNYENAQQALADLDTLEALINSFGMEMDYKKEKREKYQFFVRLDTELTTQDEKLYNDYKKNVKEVIQNFNSKNAGASLDENYFLLYDKVNINKGLYNSVRKEMFDPTKSNVEEQVVLKQTLGSPADFDELKKKIFELLEKEYTVSPAKKLDVYNMNGLFDKVASARTTVEKKLKEAKEGLANDLKTTVAETLGFEPTVRRIIEIFTAAIEVFMETIYTVSTAAEAKDNNDRTAQLEAKFGTDIVNSDIKKENLEIKEFFAWPDYREKDEKTHAYVNKYLGEVVERPQDVDELVFIDDLLAAFIKAAQESEEAKENMEKGDVTWYSVNPLDTSVFSETEPYERVELLTKIDVARLLLIRGMTFLGYSNDETTLSNEEIVAVALAEVEAMLRGVKNPNVRQTLSLMNLDFIKDVEGTINGVSRPVVKYSNGKTPFYYYDYIFKGGNPRTFKLIPISGGYNDVSWGNTDSSINSIQNRKTLIAHREDGDLFLTNYSASLGQDSTTKWPKYDDGGTYIKILSASEYNTNKQLYPIEGVKAEITPIKLEVLKSDVLNANQAKEAGFNVVGGPLGAQDFSVMDFGKPELKDLPLMFVFYRNFRTGLAYTRKATGKILKLSGPTVTDGYDYKENEYINYTNGYIHLLSSKSGKELHTNLGDNRELFNVWLNGDKSQITFPYLLQPSQGKFTNKGGGDENVSYTSSQNLPSDSFSLFGSKWYYLQDKGKVYLNGGGSVDCGKYNKAMLFLNILPFTTNGVDMDSDWTTRPDDINYIKHLFDVRAGFVHAPRLWCAYVGAYLWRLDDTDPEMDGDMIVGGGSGNQDPIYWKQNLAEFWWDIPKRWEYFPQVGNDVVFPNMTAYDLMYRLPKQVKNEFKKAFFDFVNGTDGMISWDSIRENIEIWDGTGHDFALMLNNAHLVSNGTAQNTTNKFNTYKLNQLKNKDKYKVILPIKYYTTWETNFFHLELKDGYGSNVAVTTLIDALTQEVIIANNSYAIWRGPLEEDFGMSGDWDLKERTAISATKPTFELYFNTIVNKLKETSDAFSPTNERKEIEQQIFGTANEDTIKLQLYRTCKNIHDKWLAGVVDPNNIIFQCGSGERSRVDSALAKEIGDSDVVRLIDSFRFISRSFRDIGDELYINPIPINKFLYENPNTSSYDAISSLLADNNFDFIALPTFINFRDAEEVKSIFKPFPSYTEAIKGGVCGPAFVCAYVGQKSQHLDYSNSDYPNDGFDLRCIDGNIDPSIPDDFKIEHGEHEDPVGAFVVRYSQQNQNIFKDINLDQSEFTETDESLQIQDDISQKGSETNRTIAGQNLYNVYAVRSYTAEIEMMGNAMIQPMMYFQLDNIPMFHGAYMITRVKHSIKPNNMSTQFTGVRIRYAETPLVDAMDLYMSFVDSLDAAGSLGTGGGVPPAGSLAPIVRTIVENGGLNGNIASENIFYKHIPKIDGINNLKLNDDGENIMLFNAVDPLVKMLTAWVAWMKTEGFAGNNGNYASITSVFRDYQKQVAIKQEYGSAAATPGTSPHGWGIALDLQFYRKDGSLIGNDKNTPSSFDVTKNPAIKWLYDNSYVYGFVLPYSLRDKAGLEEHWHFEYHGTAAKCLILKNPTIYGYSVKVDKELDAIVQNPKGKDGKRAVYTDCDYKAVKDSGDGIETVLGGKADYWSLIAICALENYADNPQGMADVAQSIYNRLNTPNKPYGKSIKEIVTAKGQYEPTFKNRNEWLLIKDEKTAITAVKNSKGWTDDKAKERLNKAKAAIANTTYQNNAKTFVNTRTEFLAYNPTSGKAIDVVSRTPKNTNNSFYWEYAGKALIGQSVPNPPNFSNMA